MTTVDERPIDQAVDKTPAEPLTLTDWLGTQIIVGSRIVYPGRTGSSMWLNLGEVLDVMRVPAAYSWEREHWALRVRLLRCNNWSSAGGVATLTRVDRVTVVPHPGLDVTE